MALCKCGSGLGNTGIPSCVQVPERISTLFPVSKLKNDGTPNSIPVGTTIDQTFLDGKLSAVDPFVRWGKIANFEQVENVRAENEVEESDGISRKTADGLKTFTGRIYDGASKQFADILDNMGCSEMGFYIADIDENLEVQLDKTQLLMLPAYVERGTFSAIYVEATRTSRPYINVTFSWSRYLKDGDSYIIPSDEITADLGTRALIDVTISNPTALTTTSVTFDAKSKFGTANNRAVKGLPVTAFEVFNVNTSSVVLPTVAVENTDGNYTLTFPAQTIGNVLIVRSRNTGGVYTVSGYEITPFTNAAIV
jgi:hypothetical protein